MSHCDLSCGKKLLRGHSFFMGGGGVAVVSGGHPKIFGLKGGPSQKLRGEGGSCKYMYLFEGVTQDF